MDPYTRTLTDADVDRIAKRLAQLVEKPRLYLTIREVCEMAKCSKNTVRKAIAQGDLPAFKLGRDYRFRHGDVVAWVERRGAPQDPQV